VIDERFIDYLVKLKKAEITKDTAEHYIASIRANNASPLDFTVSQIISSIKFSGARSNCFFDYLKHFSGMPTTKDEKKHILYSLRTYKDECSEPIDALTDNERSILSRPLLSTTSLIPMSGMYKALTMLASDQGLYKLINFFFDRDIDVALNLSHYEEFIKGPESFIKLLSEIFRIFKKDSEIMTKMTDLWLENNCPIFDLQVFCDKLRGMNREQISEIFDGRSNYINFIYGGRIKNVPLSEVPDDKEEILIYAITNRKNSFLRLVENNYQTFLEMNRHSVLFTRDLYNRYININSLSEKNFKDFNTILNGYLFLEELDSGYVYTFEELKALYRQPTQYYRLYNKLTNRRVDERLIVLKQLTKHSLLHGFYDDANINRLAEMLSTKPLSAWREQDLGHIDTLKPQDAIGLLAHYGKVKKLIPQMKTGIDVRLVIRNQESVHDFNDINDLKMNIVKIDAAWNNLVRQLGFSNQFLHDNQERILEFICNNGAGIVKTYYDRLSSESARESVRRVLKAELMGEFYTLKYFADDLKRELEYPINKALKETWMDRLETNNINITVKEVDDFLSTIQMGIMPQRTCLSYIDGEYKECLLSNYDSNKKILYAYKNGKVVGRAIIRLTKCRYSLDANASNELAQFTFVDIDNIGKQDKTPDDSKAAEHLIIFLERYYTASISPDEETQVVKMFIELMEKKAEAMGVMLVLSNNYANYSSDYVRTFLHIYISKSKAGSQYLDSLNGTAKVSDEGGYRSNNFLIRKDELN
jgi:hypothetical protein